MLATERAVLIRYYRDGKPRRASGLRVSGQYVLTADHCADGTGHKVVVEGDEHPAEVFVRGRRPDVDLAILKVPDLQKVPSMGCARADRTLAQDIRGCIALGYPIWKHNSIVAQVEGDVPTGEGLDARTPTGATPPLTLKITDQEIRDKQVLRGNLDQEGSQWAGMSGAVVVTRDNLVLAVVRGHSPTEGVGSLTLTPVEAINSLPEEQARRFWAALQVAKPFDLPVLPRPGGSSEAAKREEAARRLAEAASEHWAAQHAAEVIARGVVEETVEVEGTGRYYDDGWSGLTREEAERAARDLRKLASLAPAHPRVPSQPVYDDLVRSAFAELVQPGRLLFNPPDRMQLGQTERVEVRLTRTLKLDAELLRDLRGHGEPQVEEIPTAPLMAVTLKGDGFRITAYSDEEQSITQDGITTWEFDIQAHKRGQQRLVMCVSLRIPVPGQPLEHKSIPVREAVIDVQVGVPAVMQFVAGNWQWFIGTAIAIAAVVVAVLLH
jgi:hypothetical protein